MMDESSHDTSSALAETFSVDRARLLLRAALDSRHFKDSRRQSALLQYLVDEEAAGRGERISAYAIALDVFERDDSFDPSTDSIVRVEMHRLRGNLQRWNDDPENQSDGFLEIQPRSYRPRLGSKVDAKFIPASRDQRRSRLFWIGLLAVVLVIVAAGFFAFKRHKEFACRSARPEIVLPVSVRGLDPMTSVDLINRLRAMLGYYPLVTAVTESSGECSGVPQYDISLTARGGTLNASLTLHGGDQIVINSDVGFSSTSTSRDKDIAAAQIAYLIGHDAGAVADDALRRKWSNTPAAEQFRCLMSAHQYFYASANASNYDTVRRCLINEFRQSSHADVPAMLAAFELEPRFNPLLRKYPTHNYYDEAVRAASAIDSYDVELVVVKLREIRFDPHNRRGDAQILINLLARIYPYEPSALNQIAITQCKLTQEYSSAYRNIALSRQISQARIDLPYAEVFCNIATGHSVLNAKYIDKLMNDASPFILAIALHYADTVKDKALQHKIALRLADLNCANRACLRQAVREGSVNPDIEAPLQAMIDATFPN